MIVFILCKIQIVIPTQIFKKHPCKYQKANDLKNTFKKDCKKPCKTEKTHYFCTRIDAYVPRNPDKPKELKLKIYFQKRFKKVCEIRKRNLPLHPAKRATFREKLVIRVRKEGKKLFFKKLFKTLARIKRSCTFAPANREDGIK